MRRARARCVVAAVRGRARSRARASTRSAQRGAAAAAARAASRGADRSHRLLGVDRHAGLALAHGDAGQRRLPGHSADPRGAEGCRRLGSGERRSRRRAVQVLRRARADERPGAAAHHLAGRQHAEGRDGRGHADAAPALRRRPDALRRTAAERAHAGRASRRRSGRCRARTCRCTSGRRIAPRTRRQFARPADRCESSRRTCARDTCARTASPTARTPC